MDQIAPSSILTPEAPPRPFNARGERRKVGAELEFAGLDAWEVADLVQSVYGGEVELCDKHRYRVHTYLGAFTVELDMGRAHPKAAPNPSLVDKLERQVASTVGDIGSFWMPQEIAAPPIPFDELGALDQLVASLREAGALGTSASPLYGFGLHLNPEVAATDDLYVLRHLKAYLLVSDWLHDRIGMDVTRKLLRFTAPFPKAYARLVVDPAYQPDIKKLMLDYVRYNPSRNREFDMLPLFAYLDEGRVKRLANTHGLKPRPTFHYRLPDSRVDVASWAGIVGEWNRWIRVERMADNPDTLAKAGQAYLNLDMAGRSHMWSRDVEAWIDD